jgi:hypothetical protein
LNLVTKKAGMPQPLVGECHVNMLFLAWVVQACSDWEVSR